MRPIKHRISTLTAQMAGVPIDGPDTPARLDHEEQAAPRAAGPYDAQPMGFMRVRRHSHHHA
jgi:hypothetical protein